MNGITIGINPVIVHFGGLELRWYGLAIVLAVISAVLISARQAKRTGIDAEHIYSLALWAVVSGIVGARLFHVVDLWEYYVQNPQQILGFQGLAVWGALGGGAVAVIIYARTHRVPFLRLADTLTPGLLVAQIIGRFGCIINGDAYGGATTLPWGFVYTHPGALIPPDLFGIPTHPYPVYEQLWNGIALLTILWLRRRFHKDGMAFFTYLSFYSVGRFLLTFVRREKVWFWNLQEAQVIALLILVTSIAFIVYLANRRTASEKATES